MSVDRPEPIIRERPVASAPGRFDGKVAVVTASSRGIGFAIVRQLVSEGARVCLTARKEEPLRAAIGALPEGRAIAVQGRSEDPHHREETFQKVADAFGRVDILVNAAGANPSFGPLLDLELDAARKTIDVNLISALGWVQELHRHDRLGFADRGGAIVNVSSVTGQVASPGIGFYGVSKAAIDHFTSTLAVELGPRVRVNAVAPAVVRTEFSRALYEGKEDQVAAAYPLRRLGEPDDIAHAVAFLASDDAAWITGQVLTLDGGLLSAGGRA